MPGIDEVVDDLDGKICKNFLREGDGADRSVWES